LSAYGQINVVENAQPPTSLFGILIGLVHTKRIAFSVEEIPHTGHFMLFDNLESCARQIDQFLHQ